MNEIETAATVIEKERQEFAAQAKLHAELRKLREQNKQLREENQRLRNAMLGQGREIEQLKEKYERQCGSRTGR